MQINITTDNHIKGSDRMENYFDEVFHEKLKRFDDKVTSLEIHLASESGTETHGSDDKRCTIEARINNMKPVAVTHHADTVEKAIAGASAKIKKVLETTFDKVKTY